MKKLTLALPPSPEDLIFTEGIDYFNTGENSIWGQAMTQLSGSCVL